MVSLREVVREVVCEGESVSLCVREDRGDGTYRQGDGTCSEGCVCACVFVCVREDMGMLPLVKGVSV